MAGPPGDGGHLWGVVVSSFRIRAVAAMLSVLAALSALASVPAAQGATRGGRAAAPPGLAAGVISTVAGGVGGPGKATKVAVSPAGVAFIGGSLYIADALSVRKVNPATGGLTTPAGNGASALTA